MGRKSTIWLELSSRGVSCWSSQSCHLYVSRGGFSPNVYWSTSYPIRNRPIMQLSIWRSTRLVFPGIYCLKQGNDSYNVRVSLTLQHTFCLFVLHWMHSWIIPWSGSWAWDLLALPLQSQSLIHWWPLACTYTQLEPEIKSTPWNAGRNSKLVESAAIGGNWWNCQFQIWLWLYPSFYPLNWWRSFPRIWGQNLWQPSRSWQRWHPWLIRFHTEFQLVQVQESPIS